MIADGSCRMINPNIDGFALWHNKVVTDIVINLLKEELPETSKPSYFTLSAMESLKEVCPTEKDSQGLDLQEDFTCREEDMILKLWPEPCTTGRGLSVHR